MKATEQRMEAIRASLRAQTVSYTDDQDRESYTVPEHPEEGNES